MIKSTFYSKKLKPISKLFILGNIFDILTTMLGLSVGALERNIIFVFYGWYVCIFFKILGMCLVIWFLERIETWWFFWAIPVTVWLAVVNNFVVFLMLISS